ncbi:MAG TPA: hypothetical protein VL284_08845 [Thermoanaerobaculia bacterium]|nr:hypothetical protein [Thermoanaerobaculia bacterium]
MATAHVEQLSGRRVWDADGKVVGRIGAIVARRRGRDYFVDEFHLGPAALMERFGISTARIVGWKRHHREPLRVPWQQLDLSDPDHPRLRCTREELMKMQ